MLYGFRCNSSKLGMVIQFLKELHLTAFVIFFRFLRWSWTPRTKSAIRTCAAFSAATITLIEFWFLIAAGGWLEARFLEEIPKWAVGIAFLLLYAANCYSFVIRRQGPIYEREFTHLKKGKKILLLTTSITILLVAIAFFLYAMSVHRKLINHP